jgi:ribosomal protein L29
MKYKDLAALKPTDLKKKKHEVTTELIKIQAQVAVGTTPKNPGQIKQLKKILARIEMLHTIQTKEVQDKDASN